MPWLQIFILIASIALQYYSQPRPPKMKPPAFGDFDFPQHEEGTPQAVIFGDCWIEDWFVLGLGNYRTTPIKK